MNEARSRIYLKMRSRREDSGRTAVFSKCVKVTLPRLRKVTPYNTIAHKKITPPWDVFQAHCLKTKRQSSRDPAARQEESRVASSHNVAYRFYLLICGAKSVNRQFAVVEGLFLNPPPPPPRLPPHLLSRSCPENRRVGPPLSVVVLHGRVHQGLA